MPLRETQTTAVLIRDLNESVAQENGLRYVSDREKGFTRKKRGKSFQFFDHENNRVTSDEHVDRIKKLVLPPAWENVWICRHKNGHLQATGQDVRVRKQYRYHALWSQVRNETKFSKLSLFADALPDLRQGLKRDLRRGDELSRSRVLACVVRVMEETMIRIGNDEYAAENDSYGLTTIRNKHVLVKGAKTHFHFKGKSGVIHDAELSDPRLSRIIRACQELPGQELFAYVDEEGAVHDIGSTDVNSYLRELTGESITAKDFRTWGATVHAARTLAKMGPLETETKAARKKRECQAVTAAAAYLGNTSTVCRKYYVHPLILEADREGELHRVFAKVRKGANGLSADEVAVLKLLKKS